MVPLGFFLIASTNPSSWAISGVGGFWLALLTVAETTGKRRAGAVAASIVLAAMAAGSRGDAAVYIAISCVVVLLLAWKKNSGRAFGFFFVFASSVALACIVSFAQTGQAAVTAQGLASNGTPGSFSGAALTVLNTLRMPLLWVAAF